MAFIFLTTPTSGTGSLDRVIRAIGGDKYKRITVREKALDKKKEGYTYLDANSNNFYWFQGDKFLEDSIDLSRFKLIFHFRDPRDLACNQYWWALSHPNLSDSPDVAENKRVEIEKRGLESYVSVKRNISCFSKFIALSNSLKKENIVCTSYAQICVAFDLLVYKLCEIFEQSPDNCMDKLLIERPENILDNAKYASGIGQWKGSDLSPGRFKRELSTAKALFLTDLYKNELDFCGRHDANFLAHHYK